jgi:hypothetical protein
MSKQNNTDEQTDQGHRERKSAWRPILIVFLIVSIIFGGIFAWGLYELNQTAQDAIENNPLLNLGRSLLLKATPEILPDPLTIVTSVSKLARLETARVEAEKIATSERNTETLFGLFGESMVFVAVGEVIAGIDFAKMEDGDVQVVDPTTIMIHLPDSEILVATLDEDKSYVVDRDVGLFTGADKDLEREVRVIGRDAILEYALDEIKVLEVAQQNAQEYMESFLNDLGFENVIFTDAKPPIPEPYVQEIPKGMVLVTPTP